MPVIAGNSAGPRITAAAGSRAHVCRLIRRRHAGPTPAAGPGDRSEDHVQAARPGWPDLRHRGTGGRVAAPLHHRPPAQARPVRGAGGLPVVAGAARGQPAHSLTREPGLRGPGSRTAGTSYAVGRGRSALGTLAVVSGEPAEVKHGADRANGHPDLPEVRARITRGGAVRYHEAAAATGKLFARDRISFLADKGSFTEDGLYANVLAAGLPADGVITGTATIRGRPVALMANDSTVKAGSWGARTVEKIIRIIEKAYASGIPMLYLVDSAGARITDQVEMFPGRRGAGKIFHTQVRASGSIPQVCALFGPSAAGGAYIPAFCDYVAMVDGNASMYLGSPRMVEMVVREQTTLEEMGGARMHCTVSGCGHHLAPDEQDAINAVRGYLSYLPGNWQQQPPAAAPREPEPADLRAMVPVSERQAFDMRRYLRGLVDAGSLFEVAELWAREVITGFARLDGQVIGVVAN